MQVDPEVNRLKFDQEVALLVEQQATLESRYIFLLKSTAYPIVQLLFVPRHPVQAIVPTAQLSSISSPYLSGRPITLPEVSMAPTNVPALACRAFKAQFDLSDYDLRAPSLELKDPWTDELLDYLFMPLAHQFDLQRGKHLVLIQEHPITHKPFLCMRGIREYHEHPQHSGDDWLLYRGQINLFSTVMTLWRVMVDLIHPQLICHPTGTGTNWIIEEKL